LTLLSFGHIKRTLVHYLVVRFITDPFLSYPIPCGGLLFVYLLYENDAGEKYNSSIVADCNGCASGYLDSRPRNEPIDSAGEYFDASLSLSRGKAQRRKQGYFEYIFSPLLSGSILIQSKSLAFGRDAS